MNLNGPDGTIHRAIEISHTDIDVMRMFDAMVKGRSLQGGVDILGVALHFVFSMRAPEMAAEVKGSAPHTQHTFTPSYVIEASGMRWPLRSGQGVSTTRIAHIHPLLRDRGIRHGHGPVRQKSGRDWQHRERGVWRPKDSDDDEMQPQR